MLEPSKYYHIYNHANGSENLFRNDGNYHFFLKKYSFYISPIADTYAWCLMPNHFHLLVKIKEESELQLLYDKINQAKNPQGLASPIARQNLGGLISQQFSNLFNSYTKSYNKVYKRRGSLFIPNFKRKGINSGNYLLNVIRYIHRNPIHHGFCKKPDDWAFTSYHSILNENPAFKTRNEIIGLFDSKENFIASHLQEGDTNHALDMEF